MLLVVLELEADERRDRRVMRFRRASKVLLEFDVPSYRTERAKRRGHVSATPERAR